ncbi:MAG: autotransporter outer membrane beta-barrel domain-containing protein [Candidatus Omnitrophica bacterium]|nr:autotransporter outer membrane beta-barrel domain-containing protein [Candidatus Omnitrophota bacterium]MBU4590097.1 autotransporter outer membrane beta-barrel domain-containing protein [Candidatus Omnitrophota bacterium]
MKTCLVLTVCFVFIGAGRGFAEPLKEHSLGVSTEISYIMYDEPNVMEEKGLMYGIGASYTFRKDFMFNVDARYSYGHVDYKNSGTIDSIDDFMLEFRGLLGYDFSKYEGYGITPYIGLGYRYLNDDSSGMISSTGDRGYERESNYFYTPIGIEIINPLNNDWSMAAIFEYDYFWKGIQKSHLSGAVPSFSDLENDQNDGFGLRASLRFQKKGEKADFLIEPFVRYWDIEESETANITYNGVLWGFGWEPENNSTEIGIRLAAVF